MSTATEHETRLYQASPKLHPRQARGRYARLRLAAMFGLLGFFYAAPWIEAGGRPLVWFDLPHRHFHLFGLTLAPQDLIYLTWLLLIAALTLFFFTSLAGRLWCGYACPQTVWTEAFLWIERLTEGDRHARLRLERGRWTPEKLARKGGKHLLWGLLALFTGLSFVAYFVPARELFPAALSFQLTGWALFWTLFYGFATWGNAGVMREQVCKYMCPYARFQSAMFDKDTLLISYDERRGEPRKSAARKLARIPVTAEAATPRVGDCVDCSLCVQVCPVGIDIRQGLQYECIACAACIDACDGVMDGLGRPRGLIRYTSTHQQRGERFRLLRPRTVGYGLIWAALCLGFAWSMAQRTPLQFDVIRDRHSLYRDLGDGIYENLYSLRIDNVDHATHRFRLQVRDDAGHTWPATPDHWRVAAGESQAVVVSVRNPASQAVAGPQGLRFELQADDAPKLHRGRDARFIAGDDHG